MRNFIKLGQAVEVNGLLMELARQPELWGQRPYRQEYQGTPHQDIQDIWLRYNKVPESLDNKEVADSTEVVWYPEAQKLPSLQGLVLPLMAYMKAWTLDRLMITRLKPGGRILAHADDYGEYVKQDQINRLHVVLQGLPGSLFHCGNETVQMLTGEVWWFNPLLLHACENNSPEDRIHLLVDTKGWPRC